MYNFKKILGKSSRDLVKDVIYSEYDAQSFYKMVKKYYEENPEATEKDVNSYFENLFAEINYEIVHLPVVPIKNATIEYNTCRYLNRNDRECREIYEKICKEEKEGNDIFENDTFGVYTSNKLSSSRTFVIRVLKELRDLKNAYDPEERAKLESFFAMPKKLQSDYKRNLTSKERRDFEQLKELFNGNEYSQLCAFMKKCEPRLEELLKKDYIDSILILGNRFKQFGLLETYAKKQEKLFERAGIKDLAYPLTNEEETKDTLSVEDLFRKETLDKISINRLSMINAFWLNRYTKELEAMNKSFFISKKLGLAPQIRDADFDKNTGHIRIPIDDEELKKLYIKMNFLHASTNLIFRKFNKIEGEVQEIEVDGRKHVFKKIDVKPFIEDMEDDIGDEYYEYFSELQPNMENDFFTDIEDYRIMENAIHNTYRAKDMNIVAILSNLYEEDFSKNWGIIPERDFKNSKKMLLGVDFEGLNMPIRLHIDKEIVCDFLRGCQNNTLFPIYEGEKDFVFEAKPLSTHVLMPICQKQKNELRILSQKNVTSRKNLIEHLTFLADGTYPEHLKKEVVTKKKGKTKISKKIPQRRYIDLTTGEEYVKNVKGEFEPVKKTVKENGEK